MTTTTPWQYVDSSERVVFYVDGAGSMHSALATSPDVVSWVENGNTVAAAPSLSLAQQAASAIGAGITISLSGTISLSATLFPTDPATLSKISDVAATIGATGGFPGGASSLPMKDSSGEWHSFTLSQWKSVAGAVGAYAAALQLIIDGNPLEASSLPSASASLTV
jgi:hypothetical protein